MATDKDKNINTLVDKMMRATELDKPSAAFTVNIIAEINTIESEKVKYSPPISRTAWIFIGGLTLAILILVNFTDFQNQNTFLEGFFNFNYEFNFSFLNSLFSYNFSNVFIYSILLFGLMFAIQIPLLKYYHFKRNRI
jgi:hypothetical protein